MTDISPKVRAKVKRSFAAQGLMATLGGKITDLSAGEVTICAPIRPETGQQQGFAHAGLTFSIADSAAGYAALTLMPEPAEVVTSEIKINLLRPGIGTFLRATGRVIKPGRRLMVVTADVWAIDGDTRRHIAMATGTMVPVQT